MRLKNLFLLLLFPVFCSASNPELSSIRLNGERYFSLQDWAGSRGFSFSWDKTSREVNLNISWAKLEFNVNSKKAIINSNIVWLSSVIAASGEDVYVSARDLDKTLHPILYPEKLPDRKVRTIMLAAGHGGKDPGLQANSRQEKKYALLMAKVLKETLEEAGFKVLMTRDRDVFVDLEEQAEMAARAKADLFITTHYNAALEVEAKGIETYCITPIGAISTNGGEPSTWAPGHANERYSALLAYKVHKALLLNTDFADRGVRRASFVVLRRITMPGILIEGGFLSNPYDAEKITSPTYRRKTARAITEGVLAYKRMIEN